MPRIVKTYACKKAISSSRKKTAVTIDHGRTAISTIKEPDERSVHEKLIKIFKRACPDIIFANRRMAKLKTREKYETASIKVRNGAIASGTPPGIKRLPNSHSCLLHPMKLIPIKKLKEKKKVRTKELVMVKEYGSRPARFANNIVKN